MHIEVVSLLKPPATLITGEVQLGLSLVFGHVVLEGCPLPALEPTDFTPEDRGRLARIWLPVCVRGGASPHLLQRLGSRVPHLVDKEVLALLEGLATLVADVVPHL